MNKQFQDSDRSNTPWMVGGDMYVHSGGYGEGGIVARVESDADAALIAAAPDLLASLKEIVESPSVGYISSKDGSTDAVLDRARKAVERAELGPWSVDPK